MRTTVAIDDDLHEKLRTSAAKRRISLARMLNEVLRRGFSAPRPRGTERPPFHVEPFESAFRPGVDPLQLNKLADDLDIRDRAAPGGR